MPIIKSDERRAAEAQTLREFGVNAQTANAEQREYAEHITAGNKHWNKEFQKMEEKSK
jgi:hypothetical protein